MLKLLFKNFWNFSVHNLAPEDISVVAGVGDSITVCTEYRITKALHASSFDTFYIFWYIKFYIKWEMNWSWLDLTWPWLVLDLTLTGRLRVSCWWYLIGFRLARGYRRRPSSVSSLSTADSLGGKRIRSPGVRWKLDGSLNIIVLLQQLQNFTKSELDHQTFLSPRGARCLRVGYCKRCC